LEKICFIKSAQVGFDATAIIELNVEPLKMDEITEHISNFYEMQNVATSSRD